MPGRGSCAELLAWARTAVLAAAGAAANMVVVRMVVSSCAGIRCRGEGGYLSVMVKLLLWPVGAEVTATVAPLVLTRV